MKRFFKILPLFMVIYLAIIIISGNKVNAESIELTSNGYVPKVITVTNRYDFAKEVFDLVNNERESNGKSKLKYDKTLTDAAMIRAAELTELYSHTRPNGEDNSTISEYWWGENIGKGQLSPSSVMNAWMNSNDHKENILRDFNTIGVGCISKDGCNYWVQLFGKEFTTAETRTEQVVTDVTIELPYSDFKIKEVQSKRIAIGNTLQLSTSLVYNNVTYDIDNSYISYTSSNDNIATVTNDGLVKGISEGEVTITAKNGNTISTIDLNIFDNSMKVLYRTHVQNVEWQDYVSDGKISGTSGQALRLEAICIKLKNQEYPGSIEYSTHVQNIGWQDYVSNDEIAGTSGQALRLEAIKIRLTGELAEYYDIYYRVHAQNLGWMTWAKNDESAGSQGYSYRLEAIEIVLVKKDNDPPSRSNINYSECFKCPRLSYRTHVENIGWQGKVNDEDVSGTSGRSLRLEAIEINLENQEYSGSIEYSTHVQNIGWQGFVKNGSMAGTSGQSLRLEGIKIKLTGKMNEKYDIYYRVHAQNLGWMGWAKNGEEAGSEGFSYRLEAIQIQLVKKGEKSPGSTENRFVSNK